MKAGRTVLVWRVDIPFLTQDHWKYEGSTAAEGHGGRTHTFGVKNPKSIVSKAILYQLPTVRLTGGKPCLADAATQE